MRVLADWRIELIVVLMVALCAGAFAEAFGQQPRSAAKPQPLWTARVDSPVQDAYQIWDIFPRIAFHPDGGTVATERNGDVELREVATGKVRVKFRAADKLNVVTHIAFSPDGRLLAVASPKLGIGLFDPADGKQVGQFLLKICPSLMAFSPDGKYLASCEGTGLYCVFEVGSGKLLHQLRGRGGYGHLTPRVARWLAFSPQGDTFTWPADAGDIGHLELSSGKQRKVHPAFPAVVHFFLHYSPDGRWLLVNGAGPTVCMIDAQTGKLVHHFLAAEPAIDADQFPSAYGEFSPDGKYVITTEARQAAPGDPLPPVRQWDAQSGKLLRTLQAEPGEVACFSFSADKKLLAVSNRAGRVNFFDLATGRELTELRIEAKGLIAGVFSPDSRHVAVWTAEESSPRAEVTMWSLGGKAGQSAQETEKR